MQGEGGGDFIRLPALGSPARNAASRFNRDHPAVSTAFPATCQEAALYLAFPWGNEMRGELSLNVGAPQVVK